MRAGQRQNRFGAVGRGIFTTEGRFAAGVRTVCLRRARTARGKRGGGREGVGELRQEQREERRRLFRKAEADGDGERGHKKRQGHGGSSLRSVWLLFGT